MKFDDPKAGNSLKDRRLCGELKECVPITARTNRFPLKKGKSTVITERKQFLLILGHLIAILKSQGSTLAYIQGDLNQSTGKKTAIGKNYQQPISQGQFYTLFSYAKSRDKVLLLNFDPEDIKANELAIDDPNEERVIIFPATPLNRFEWYFYVSIQYKGSWNVHSEHFLSDKVYSVYSSQYRGGLD